MSDFLIHYGELALKKGNRGFFENRLINNIKFALSPLGRVNVEPLYGRIHISFSESLPRGPILQRLSKVFGIVNFSPVKIAVPSIESIRDVVKDALEDRKFESFAIRAKRAEKKIPFSSQDVNREIGAFVNEISGARVDLTNPELTVWIEILEKGAYIYLDKLSGTGGLPIGVSGKVISLISGGIDSPVASWRIMKRGCIPVYLHFHSAPFTSDASKDKVVDLVTHIMEGQPKTKIYVVPFGEIQQKIVVSVPPAYRVIMYRRFMLRIAERVAHMEKALALVTGDALSQVASQTLSNLATIGSVTSLPILRPLVGMDKQEIVDEARKIGTFDIAIQPHDDCCTFLMPDKPVTHTTISEVEGLEKGLDIEAMVNLGLESLEKIDI